MLLQLFRWLRFTKAVILNALVPDFPIPGLDFHFLAQCNECDNYGGFASVDGGKHYHCHNCGDRSKTINFQPGDIEAMRRSSWCHWKKYHITPYYWHLLSEDQKWDVLAKHYPPKPIA